MRIDGALVSFRTRDHATVNEIIVYDGDQRIAEHMDQDLRGENPEYRVDIPGSPEINRGINVVLGVSFDSVAPDARSMQIEIIGVGLEYTG
jgi:DNA-binding PucR family transcriptional regulator